MKITFAQAQGLTEVLTSLADTKVSFKLGLIVAKDIPLLQKEIEFFIEQERKFAQEYIEVDEDGNYVGLGQNSYKIKEDKLEEARKAREDLDTFESEVELRKIPMSLLENLELTPKQIAALEIIIEEE